MDLYPYLKSNMAKVPAGTVYDGTFIPKIEVNKDGMLFLLPEVTYDQ